MRPTFTLNDHKNTMLADSKFSGESVSAASGHSEFVFRSNLQDLLFGKRRIVMPFSTNGHFAHRGRMGHPLRLASLLNLVSHVVSMGANEKMARVKTFWPIATMKALKTCWDFVIKHFPRNPMRPLVVVAPIPTAFKASTNPNPTRSKRWLVFWNWPILVDVIPERVTRNCWSAHINQSYQGA